jgi:hypothetical protein
VSSERRDLVYEASVSVFGEAGSAIRGFGECLRRGGIWPYEASVSVFGVAGSAIRGFGGCLRRGGIWPYEASVGVFGEAGFGPTRLR